MALAGNVRCDVNDFYSTLMEMVQECVDQNVEALVENVNEASDSAIDSLKSMSWRHDYWTAAARAKMGLYNQGWKAYRYRVTDGHYKVTIANTTKPTLTHLLERGHAMFIWGKPTGRRVRAIPHISTAYEVGAAKLMGGLG